MYNWITGSKTFFIDFVLEICQSQLIIRYIYIQPKGKRSIDRRSRIVDKFFSFPFLLFPPLFISLIPHFCANDRNDKRSFDDTKKKKKKNIFAAVPATGR